MSFPIHRPGQQRGAATLVSAVILLVLMTLVTFFANRNIVFERKTAANQYRSTKALEAAEAGIEWALANLNSSRRITAACATSTVATDRSFRDRYLDPDGNGLFGEPFSTANPTCTFNGATWSCSCPAEGFAPVVVACASPAGCPTFRTRLAKVAGDDTLIQLTSVGCTDAQRPCVAGAGGTADGTATVTQIVKIASGLATIPAAAITAKGYVDFGANAITATNTDPGTNGITINAGGDITGFINASTIKTMPGTPVQGSLVGNDASLASLSDDKMFQSFFGTTKEAFRDAPTTTQVSCAGVCGNTLLNAIERGARTIWVEGDMVLNSNDVFGSPTDPVIVVVNGNIEVRGDSIFYGVLYCQNSAWDNTGGGNALVVGAAISEGNFTATGTPDPTYDPDVLRRLNQTTGVVAKVPGGWRDF